MGKRAWVPILWGKCRDLFTKYKAKDSSIPNLPHDIIINILSRLPANCIFQLWQTKNLLYDLTTTRHFIRTHLDRATPTIAVLSLKQSQDSDDEIKLFLFEYGKAKATTSFDLISPCDDANCMFWGSYDGFLLFNSSYFHILNPITKEQVIVTRPPPKLLCFVCGFYFHPHTKEYEVVWVRHLRKQFWDYQILNLRTKHTTSIGSYPFCPSIRRPPVFINATFYWMGESGLYCIANHLTGGLSEELPEPEPILSLNIETKEFRPMQVFKDAPPGTEREFQLFELDGELSLFGTSSAKEVGIWVFNYNENCWVKKHSITSPNHEHNWKFRSYFGYFEYIKTKGEFIAYDRLDKKKQPLVYNLKLATWNKAVFQRKGFGRNGFALTSYTPSLVSLDAADPDILL